MSKYLILTLLLITLCSIHILAETDTTTLEQPFQIEAESYIAFQDISNPLDPIPTLKPEKVLLEIAGGIGGGVLGGVAGGFIGYQLSGFNSTNGWEDVIGILLGSIIGYTVGGPLGVYMIGSTDNETGSLFATMGGGILGTIAFSALSSTMYLGSDDLNVLFMVLASPIGATIGFNSTRRYASSYSLINLKNRVISFNIPSLKTTYKQESKSFVSYANLLQVSF